MPIYEYRCEKCGDFELTQRISDPPVQRCPKCRRKVRRLISSTSFQLKGSGWYVTDYARGGAKKEREAASNGGAGESASEAKADAKVGGAGEKKKSETKASSGAGGTSATTPGAKS